MKRTTWSRRAADMHLDIAWQLCERLPAVWEALHAGDIDLPRARVICDQTAHLDVEEARRVADAVLVEAGERTTGQLKARLRRLVIETNPEAEAERYRQGVEARRVVLDANSDGTANLAAWDLPADGAQAAMVHVNRLARAVKTADDPRTLDQVRADVLLDLLQGIEHDDAERSMGRAAVDIRVDLTTLLGLSESAAEIPGWGPVIAEVARRVVDEQHDALWSFAVTGDDDQNLVWSDVTRRRPTAAQSRHVQARDRTCVFPGCRIPARSSDLDHRVSHAEGGPTHTTNLAPLCRHDHRLKHEGGWTLTLAVGGTYNWTSRLGQKYVTQPQEP